MKNQRTEDAMLAEIETTNDGAGPDPIVTFAGLALAAILDALRDRNEASRPPALGLVGHSTTARRTPGAAIPGSQSVGYGRAIRPDRGQDSKGVAKRPPCPLQSDPFGARHGDLPRRPLRNDTL